MIRKTKLFIVVFLISTLWCFGYIDPGTGSYMVQILIAAFVALSLGIKIFWKNIKQFFGRLFSKNKKEAQ
jgi:hypothetical protein